MLKKLYFLWFFLEKSCYKGGAVYNKEPSLGN